MPFIGFFAGGILGMLVAGPIGFVFGGLLGMIAGNGMK